MTKRPTLIILAVIMCILTVFVYASAIWTLQNGLLPFGMQHELRPNPTEVGVMLVILSILLSICDVTLIIYAASGTLRAVENWFAFFSWIMALLIFVYGLGSAGYEWVYFLILTVPPMVTWLMTGPSIRIGSDAW